MGYVSPTIQANSFSHDEVATVLVDPLWDDDNVESLASAIYNEAEEIGNQDNLETLCRMILRKLGAEAT